MNKKHVTLIVIIVLLSIVLVIGSTYAFFIANVSGNENAEEITIKSGDFELTFVDTQGIYFEEDIRPGESASKTFTVENTGTADDIYTYNYNIKLTELDVTYEKQDLEYTLQEYTDDNYDVLKPDGVNQTGYINKNTVNEDGEMYLAINIERPPKGELHYYKLTIEFKSLDGVNQNYNQGKTFGGKINVDDNREARLYIPTTAFSEIIKVDNETIFDDDPGQNLRYAGSSEDVHNYIWFNCDDYEGVTKDNATEKGCEKWRIIGLFKNITKTEGGEEDLVKIIRDSAGTMKWDNSGSDGSNNWSRPADLQTSLTSYYNGTQLSSAKGITDKTRPMIEQVTWNLGGTPNYYKNLTAIQFYTAERGSTIYQSQPSTWDGYIGLMYPSDYGYATVGSDSSDRAACLSTYLYSYSSTCYQKDWLYISRTYQWTLTPYSDSSTSVSLVNDMGSFTTGAANNTFAVRPSLYLKSNVKVVDGEEDGSNDIPYILLQSE